jgi:hypothetical protein
MCRSSGKDRTSWTTTLHLLGRDLVRVIGTLVESPGRWILILDVGEPGGRYVQPLVHEDGSILYEASSNNFADGTDRLSPQQEEMLEQNAWTRPKGKNRPSWWAAEASIYPDTKAVATRVLETPKKVLAVGSSEVIKARLISSPRRGCTPASQLAGEQPLPDFPDSGSWRIANPDLPFTIATRAAPFIATTTSPQRPRPWPRHCYLPYSYQSTDQDDRTTRRSTRKSLRSTN